MARKFTTEDHENHLRLRKLWNQKRSLGEINQTKAGKALGISQAVVAQYLNGNIALNTDTILGFSKYLNVHPADIDPSLKEYFERDNDHPEIIEVPIIATLSGAPVKRNPDGSFRTSKILKAW